jgi:hypothetical protein
MSSRGGRSSELRAGDARPTYEVPRPHRLSCTDGNTPRCRPEPDASAIDDPGPRRRHSLRGPRQLLPPRILGHYPGYGVLESRLYRRYLASTVADAPAIPLRSARTGSNLVHQLSDGWWGFLDSGGISASRPCKLRPVRALYPRLPAPSDHGCGLPPLHDLRDAIRPAWQVPFLWPEVRHQCRHEIRASPDQARHGLVCDLRGRL